jgi:hypothetical protein
MFYKNREAVEANPEAASSQNTQSSDSGEKAFLSIFSNRENQTSRRT